MTSLPRTLVDIAGALDTDGLRDAFEDADRKGLLLLPDLVRACERAPRARGTRVLRRLIREASAPEAPRSVFEKRFMHFCRRFDLPMPEVNAPVAGLTVDALWAEHRLIVELDSWEYHGKTRVAPEHDRERDVTLALAGYTVIRLTWRRLESEPVIIAAELRALMTRPVLRPKTP